MSENEAKAGISVDDLYEHIVKHITPEQALRKLLGGAILQYEKLKFDENENPVHPEFIIAMAAMDLGWQIAVEKSSETVQGLIVGTKEYIDRTFPENGSKEDI